MNQIIESIIRCVRCNKILHSSISRGYHNYTQPYVGYCGMCAKEMNTVSESKGGTES